MKKSFTSSLVSLASLRKRGIISEYLPWLILGVVVLVILALAIFIMKDKGTALIDQLKNLFHS